MCNIIFKKYENYPIQKKEVIFILKTIKNNFNFIKTDYIFYNLRSYDYNIIYYFFYEDLNFFSIIKKIYMSKMLNAKLKKAISLNFDNEYIKYLKYLSFSFQFQNMLINSFYDEILANEELFWNLIWHVASQCVKINKNNINFIDFNKKNIYYLINLYLLNSDIIEYKYNLLLKIYSKTYKIKKKVPLKHILFYFFLKNFDIDFLNIANRHDIMVQRRIYNLYERYLTILKLSKMNEHDYTKSFKNILEEKQIKYKLTIFFPQVITYIKKKNFKRIEKKIKQLNNNFIIFLKKKLLFKSYIKIIKLKKILKKCKKNFKYKNVKKKINIIFKNNIYLKKIYLKYSLQLKKLKKLKNLNFFNLKDNTFSEENLTLLHKFNKNLYFDLMELISKNTIFHKIYNGAIEDANELLNERFNFFLNFKFKLYTKQKGLINKKTIYKKKNLTIYSTLLKKIKILYILNKNKNLKIKNLNYKKSIYFIALRNKLFNNLYISNDYTTFYKKLIIIKLYKKLSRLQLNEKYENIHKTIDVINNNNLLISNKVINILMKSGKKELIRKKINTVYFLLRSVYGFSKPRKAVELALTKYRPVVKLKKHRKGGILYNVPYPIYSEKHQIFMSYKIFLSSLKEYNMKNFAKEFSQYFALEIFLSLINHPKSFYIKKLKEYHNNVSNNRSYLRFLKNFK